MAGCVPKGRRPGPISAYGTAIGIAHRHEWRAKGPVSFPVSRAGTDESGLQPSDLSFADQNLGLYPRLVSGRAVGARPGDVQPPGLSKNHIPGWFNRHIPDLPKNHIFGLFGGQRPGPIPAYGTAIGNGHRHEWRAESPVSFPVSRAGTVQLRSSLQKPPNQS